MLRYLVPSSIEQYPELSAFLQETNPDELQRQAPLLKERYALDFSIPKHVVKTAFPRSPDSDEQLVNLRERVSINEIVGYFGGLDRLKALLGNSLKESNSDLHPLLLAILIGRKETAQMLMHLNTLCSPTDFQTTLISSIATAMYLSASPEEGKLIVESLPSVFDHNKVIFLCLLAKAGCEQKLPSFDAAIQHLLQTAPVSTTIDCGSYQQIEDFPFEPDWNSFADMLMRTDGLQVKVTFGKDQLNPETAERFSRHTQAVDSQRSDLQDLSVFASSRTGGPASAHSVNHNP